MKLHYLLRAYGACASGLAWAADWRNAQDAWDNCPDIGNMYWALDVTSTDRDKLTRAMGDTIITLLGDTNYAFRLLLQEFLDEINHDPVRFDVLDDWQLKIEAYPEYEAWIILYDLYEFYCGQQDAWAVITSAVRRFAHTQDIEVKMCNQLRELVPDIAIWMAANTPDDGGPNEQCD